MTYEKKFFTKSLYPIISKANCNRSYGKLFCKYFKSILNDDTLNFLYKSY